MCSCAYTCTSQGGRAELSGKMIRTDSNHRCLEYKRIRNTNRKLIACPLSIITQATLEFGTQICFARVQASQKMSARNSHGDGSDCPLCSLHDGDLGSLQGDLRLSLFGNKLPKNNFSEALKTSLETSQTAQKSPLEAASGGDTPRDRCWTNFGIDFGSDFEVQIELRKDQKSSSKKHMLPRSLQKRFGIVLRSILGQLLSA